MSAEIALEAASATGRYEWRAADDRLIWSDGLLRIYGLSAAPKGEAGFSRLVHPEDRVRVESETASFLGSTASEYHHLFRIVRADGETRLILDRGVIERDGEGRVLVIRGINVDLTELPRNSVAASVVDDSAIQRFAELEALYTEAPLGLGLLDCDLRFVRINPALAAINGFSVQQHLGRTVWDLVPNLRRSAEPALRRVFETGLPLRNVSVVGETPARPGVVREWREHFFPLRGADGLVQGIGIVCEDVTERVAAESALADSEARLAAALQGGRLGVHEFDPRTGALKWDPVVRSIWGVSDDEPINYATFCAGIHPDDIEATERAVDAALDPAGPRHYEAVYRVIHRETKAVHWVRADGGVDFRDGVAVRLIGTVKDITERKRMEAALALSEHRFRLALSGSPITIFEQDRDLRYEWVFNAKLGLSDDFAVGKTDDDIVDPAAAKKLTAFKRRVMERGEPGREEVVSGLPGAPAGHYDLHAHPRFDEAGRVIGLICVSTEITDRKRAEEALRESEQRFRNMADNASVMVWVTEPDGACTYLSVSWYEFTGQSREEALGFGWLRAVHPEDAARSEQIFREANARQEGFRLDYRLRRADGAYRWAIDEARPRRGADGQFMGFVGSVIDITERKEAEAHKAYLLRLADAIRPLDSAPDIQAAAARILGEELRAGKAAYYELGTDNCIVVADTEARQSFDQDHPLALFTQTLREQHRSGAPIVVADIKEAHSAAEAQHFKHLGANAYLYVPLAKNRASVSGLAIYSRTPRTWTEAEVATAQETAERTWAAIERAQAEEQRRQSESRYRTLFDAIDEGFCVIEVRFDAENTRADYRVLEANPAFYERTGFPRTILGLWLREAAPALEEHWYETYGRVALTGEASRFQQHSKMLGRWFEVSAFRIDEPKDLRVAILFNDITARKQNEEKAEFLMHEVSHRSKNMLALVQAIANQTAAAGSEDFSTRFGQRVQALAANQDLLVKGAWKEVALEDLIRSQIGHFEDRVVLAGPKVQITATAAQSLGMALHELATNAAKYGALSNGAGRIDLSWELQTLSPSGERFTMSWVETGGPHVDEPVKRGFGSTVIEKMVSSNLRCKPELHFRPTGVVWRIDCAAEFLLTER